MAHGNKIFPIRAIGETTDIFDWFNNTAITYNVQDGLSVGSYIYTANLLLCFSYTTRCNRAVARCYCS